MNHLELSTEVQELRKLVDSLCVSLVGWKDDNRFLYGAYRSKAINHGHRLLAEAEARNRLERLDRERRTLLEDYPHLQETRDERT